MLRVDVWKNSITASSSKDGELDTSTTTSAPSSASASPSPVSVLTPVPRSAATASCPCSPSFSTILEPRRPLPPMTTIFMSCLSLEGSIGGASRAVQGRAQDGHGLRDGGAGRVRLAERVEHHEVVDGTVVADGRDRDLGGAQACRVGLALVAKHVGFVDDHQRRRHAGELVVAGAQH